MKENIKISWDLWGTLIKSGPGFKQARIDLIYTNYNPKNLSKESIQHIYKNQKDDADLFMTTFGQGVSTQQLYTDLLNELGHEMTVEAKITADDLCNDINALLLTYPVVPYDDNTLNVITNLKNQGYRMNILSNTNFLIGSALRQEVKRLFGDDTFSFMLFSDQGVFSKPNKKYFDRVKNLYDVPSDHVIHIGDNIECDFLGAEQAGMTGFLINNPLNENTILDVINLIN